VRWIGADLDYLRGRERHYLELGVHGDIAHLMAWEDATARALANYITEHQPPRDPPESEETSRPRPLLSIDPGRGRPSRVRSALLRSGLAGDPRVGRDCPETPEPPTLRDGRYPRAGPMGGVDYPSGDLLRRPIS